MAIILKGRIGPNSFGHASKNFMRADLSGFFVAWQCGDIVLARSS
jgi:hypothetical protein